jgi:hypothetical protein
VKRALVVLILLIIPTTFAAAQSTASAPVGARIIRRGAELRVATPHDTDRIDVEAGAEKLSLGVTAATGDLTVSVAGPKDISMRAQGRFVISNPPDDQKATRLEVTIHHP